VAAAAATVLLVVASVDPNEPGQYPTCPFLQLSGLACPGCGTLRALHALVHLDLRAAASLNVLTVCAVPVLAAVWGRWLRRQWAGRLKTQLAPPWRLWALLAVVVAFWVLRNLPVTSALAP
jgi:hypothetical protein